MAVKRAAWSFGATSVLPAREMYASVAASIRLVARPERRAKTIWYALTRNFAKSSHSLIRHNEKQWGGPSTSLSACRWFHFLHFSDNFLRAVGKDAGFGPRAKSSTIQVNYGDSLHAHVSLLRRSYLVRILRYRYLHDY
jgi:hypothetical protein